MIEFRNRGSHIVMSDFKQIYVLNITLGHGFKLSPVIGKVLSELALGKKPSYDLSPFNIDRASGQ